MSKGSPIIKCRIKHLMLARIEREMREREESDVLSPWTLSDYIIESILFRWAEMDRKAKYGKGRKRKPITEVP
jgi:hypothetical protein